MLTQLLAQVGIYCIFPLLLSFEKTPQTRRVSLYIYVSIVLIMGGFLGTVYSIQIFNDIHLSGGTLAYGGFMMACVMMAFIENDAFILQNIMRLVVMITVFKLLLFTSVAATLVQPGILNPLNIPASLFELSLPLILFGAVLIILELYFLFFIFDRLKLLLKHHIAFSLVFSVSFMAVIVMDGILFPILAIGVNQEAFSLIIGNLRGKGIIALTFGTFLMLFMLMNRQRLENARKDPMLNWRLLLSSSSRILKTLEQKEQQLRQANTVFEHSREGIAVLDDKFLIVNCNPALEQQFNSETKLHLQQNNFLKMLGIDKKKAFLVEYLASNDSWTSEVNWEVNNTHQHGQLTLVAITDSQHQTQYYTASLTNVSELVTTREELRFLAHHDVLTSLPNRRALQALLSGTDLKNGAKGCVLLLIDLDNFKQVNDSFGHFKGDRLLIQISRRLKQVIPKNARLFRIGGDEFSVYCENIDNLSEVMQIANAIRLQVSYPCDIEPTVPVYVDCCIGISIYPDFAGSPDELYQQADTALYWAKGIGKGNVKLYQQSMTDSRLSSLTMESLLRESIDAQHIETYFQPKVDIATGAICGAEVLARWKHDGQMIPPDVFIPLAEESGLINSLTHGIMIKACDALQQIQQQLSTTFTLAVNISASQLANEQILNSLRSVIKEFGLKASDFELELTETSLIDVELSTLVAFKKEGYTLALDDFGTGYSSLSYLNKLPIDTLKIDKSFVANIPAEQSSINLTRSIIKIAEDLGCVVVAEGVETEDQLSFLAAENCQYAQGYIYSRPLPLDEFLAYLRHYNSDRK